ncbi:MAG TPA: hypothetical protein VHM70_29405 [Polyangiaceae bacterium]|jgi:hypothetical protein|nr:hypothetical protein [Polyangiaceae bacterium]
MNESMAAAPVAIKRNKVRKAGPETELVSLVVVEEPELASSCLGRLLALDRGTSANRLYSRGHHEGFSDFADRALRHALAPAGPRVGKVTYFMGHDDALQKERLCLVASYLRALGSGGKLTLVAPAEQKRSVLGVLAALRPGAPPGVHLGVLRLGSSGALDSIPIT